MKSIKLHLIVLVSVVVFIGTYIGSAIIAQVILKSIGQI